MEKKTSQLQAWERRYGRPLSKEDYRQICEGLDGFFTQLKKWDSANQSQKGESNDHTRK